MRIPKTKFRTLNEKQVEFTLCVALWLSWCFEEGHLVVLAEAFRPPELAEIYAKQKRGIRNSNHCKKLAVDVFRYVDGRVSWNRADYEAIGEKWKTMHPLARRGGDFPRRDCVHFSFEHRGVQ